MRDSRDGDTSLQSIMSAPTRSRFAMTDSDTPPVRFECDQCGYEEWRPEDQEPWLCVVCGYMRWRVVGVAQDPELPSESGRRPLEDETP